MSFKKILNSFIQTNLSLSDRFATVSTVPQQTGRGRGRGRGRGQRGQGRGQRGQGDTGRQVFF